MDKLLEDCIAIAKKAGEAVLEIYKSDDFGETLKDNNSPLTKADIAADDIIHHGLRQISDYPIVSEESEHDSKGSEVFWLVDPIDGTREFINRNGEFTINIGLVKNGQPVLGVVYTPAKDLLYFGVVGEGAYKETKNKRTAITSHYKGKVPTVVVSRSHKSEKTVNFLKSIGKHKEVNMGSSLKLCLVAEGKATIYPRFVPTCLWDTAAADAIVRAAGGSVLDLKSVPLNYDTAQIKNPYFIAKVDNWSHSTSY